MESYFIPHLKCFLTHNMQYKGYHGNLSYFIPSLEITCVSLLTICNTKDTMVTYFIPSHEMFPYSQYAIQRIPWYLILYHHMKSVLTIYNTKDTMITYFMKCVLTHNMQYKGYHGNLFYAIT